MGTLFLRFSSHSLNTLLDTDRAVALNCFDPPMRPSKPAPRKFEKINSIHGNFTRHSGPLSKSSKKCSTTKVLCWAHTCSKVFSVAAKSSRRDSATIRDVTDKSTGILSKSTVLTRSPPPIPTYCITSNCANKLGPGEPTLQKPLPGSVVLEQLHL